jgi:hypothetical protein
LSAGGSTEDFINEISYILEGPSQYEEYWDGPSSIYEISLMKSSVLPPADKTNISKPTDDIKFFI